MKRVSVGSALARLALGAFIAGAQEMIKDVSFHFADRVMGFAKIERHFRT